MYGTIFHNFMLNVGVIVIFQSIGLFHDSD